MIATQKRCNSMILVDFSGIMFQNIFASVSIAKPIPNETGKYSSVDFMPVAKGLILDTLFNFQRQYSQVKGDITICLDDNSVQNWRRSILPYYKSTRKLNREESEIPFDEVFKDIDEFLRQIRVNTPWKVVSVPSAEADDVILCLAKHFSVKEPVLIVSSDKDMIQAQRYPNVSQYSPMTKSFVTPESKGGDMTFWLTEHVMLGDSADEIPKVTDYTQFSDSFYKYLRDNNYDYTEEEYSEFPPAMRNMVEFNYNVLNRYNKKDIWKNIRFGPKTVQKMLENNSIEEFLDSNPLYRKNYERNRRLILDDYIPDDIRTECIRQYTEQSKEVTSENTRAFKDYLVSSGLSQFAETLPFNFVSGVISIEDFL